MTEELNNILQQAEKEIPAASTSQELTELHNKYLGKSGLLTRAMQIMKDLSNDMRREFGQKVNQAKQTINELVLQAQKDIERKQIEKELAQTKAIDLTIPTTDKEGSLHPITIVQKKVVLKNN